MGGQSAALFVLALAFSGTGTAISATPADTRIVWIKELGGVSVTSQRDTDEGLEIVYGVSGDVIATLGRIREGLSKRGWTIEEDIDSSFGTVIKKILIAANEGAQVEVVASRTGRIQDIVLTLKGGGSRTGSETPGSSSSARTRGPAETGGARIDLIQDEVTGTYECRGSRVTLSGNRGNITLKGKCTYVVVTGNQNTVRIQGGVEAISAVGSNNVVIWSAAENPTSPRVTNIGTGNEILKK
jgi:hypothetical protein